MIYIGIDPGAKGGYAWIWDGTVKAMPWDDTFFVHDMHCLVATGEGIIAAVEKVGPVHGNGIVSMFNFGKNAGYIEGVLVALGIPYQLIPPMRWKKEFSLINQNKQASIMTCKHLYPALDLKRSDKCRTDSDGKAESVLLAEFARRHL